MKRDCTALLMRESNVRTAACSIRYMSAMHNLLHIIQCFDLFQNMKLRSHEILSHPYLPPVTASTTSSSKFKQLFQRKAFFKKKSSTSGTTPSSSSSNARNHIPNYVRKSLLRFLLEVGYPTSTFLIVV